jgi:large subunit ribosomal protein L15
MNLSTIRAPRKASENRKRVGRGMGSGMGKTSTRGHKGQRSRSGARQMRGFEGGQMPLHRRLPKRGFTNIFKIEYAVVNLSDIANLGEKNVTIESFHKSGLVRKKKLPIKVLGDGELKGAVTVQAHKFSKTAQEKITKAGGKFETLGGVEESKPETKPEAKAEAKPEGKKSEGKKPKA